MRLPIALLRIKRRLALRCRAISSSSISSTTPGLFGIQSLLRPEGKCAFWIWSIYINYRKGEDDDGGLMMEERVCLTEHDIQIQTSFISPENPWRNAKSPSGGTYHCQSFNPPFCYSISSARSLYMYDRLVTGQIEPGVRTIQELDAISNNLCLAVDAAELARNVHYRQVSSRVIYASRLKKKEGSDS